MSGGISGNIRGAVARVFPDRRVYIRSDRHARYLEISPYSQLGCAVVAACAIGWMAFATVTFVSRATDASQAEFRLEAMAEAYEAQLLVKSEENAALQEEMEIALARGDAISAQLSDKQQRLVAQATALREAELEVGVLRESHAVMLEARREAEAQIADLTQTLSQLRLDLASVQSQESGIDDALGLLAGTMDRVIADRDEAAQRSEELDQSVTRLQSEITQWENRQERVLSQLENAARTSLSALNKVFERANIDLENILRETKRDYSGAGGLFEPVEEGDQAEFEADARIAALMSDLERVNLMRLAADRLPFGRPTVGARLTSGFGLRRDPFRGRTAMHNGVDFAAPRGTPIFATANGVVTFSGRQRGYGIVVKIKHAFGFETLYAHLSRSRVKVGDHVERGDRIADMGSTGRSTGTHLHYEIRIDKEPVNPAKFIEAARDVL
ncbi:MAG: DUF5930 domain-containing protein [Pseudomonadota bacterium]